MISETAPVLTCQIGNIGWPTLLTFAHLQVQNVQRNAGEPSARLTTHHLGEWEWPKGNPCFYPEHFSECSRGDPLKVMISEGYTQTITWIGLTEPFFFHVHHRHPPSSSFWLRSSKQLPPKNNHQPMINRRRTTNNWIWYVLLRKWLNINIPSDLLPSHDFDEIAMSSQYRGNFWKKNSLLFFSKKVSVVNPYRVLCPKTSRIRTPLFIAQSVARVCPVWARMSLSWHSQRHCWLLMYIHKSLLGLPPTVLVMEFGIPSFSKVQ